MPAQKENKINRAARVCLTAVLVLAIIASTLFFANTLEASAAESAPEFSINVDKTTAQQGDTVTVTFVINNATDMPVTAFSGRITYNNNFYKFLDIGYYSAMDSTVVSGYDSTYLTDNSVKFVYSDSSGTVLLPDGKSKAFFQVTFRVMPDAPVGTPYFGGVIDSCYGTKDGGEIQLNPSGVVQRSVTIRSTTTTRATTTTTTAATTTTTRPRSNDATLSTLQISPGTLTPEFSPENIAYTVNVEYEIATISIIAIPTSNSAIATGTGVKALNVGTNSFVITVTAEDGTTRQYGLLVVRAPEAVSSEVSSQEVSSQPVIISSSDIVQEVSSQEMPLVSIGDNVSVSSYTADAQENSSLKVIGIIVAEIALFFFGFLSGYYIDKTNRRKREAEREYYRARRRMEYDEEDYSDYDEYDEESDDDEDGYFDE